MPLSKFRSIARTTLVASVAVLIHGCGSPPTSDEPPSAASPSGETVVAIVSVDVAEAVRRALDRPWGAFVRRTRAAMGEGGLVLITYLQWSGDTGRVSRELTADESLLSAPGADEQLMLMSEGFAVDDRDLQGLELERVKLEAGSSMTQLLHDVVLESDGSGWWSIRLDNGLETQSVEVHVVDEVLRRLSRTLETMGTTSSDSWEFVG